MKKTFHNLTRVISFLSAGISLIVLFLMICGYRPFVLSSESMEPLYRKGSLILVDTDCSLSDVTEGDVLVYRSSSNMLVMHRMISRSENGEALLQGDQNQAKEQIDLSTALVGKAVFQIAGIGSLFHILTRVPWLPWIIVLILTVMACLPCRKEKSDEGKENAHSADSYGRSMSAAAGDKRNRSRA